MSPEAILLTVVLTAIAIVAFIGSRGVGAHDRAAWLRRDMERMDSEDERILASDAHLGDVMRSIGIRRAGPNEPELDGWACDPEPLETDRLRDAAGDLARAVTARHPGLSCHWHVPTMDERAAGDTDLVIHGTGRDGVEKLFFAYLQLMVGGAGIAYRSVDAGRMIRYDAARHVLRPYTMHAPLVTVRDAVRAQHDAFVEGMNVGLDRHGFPWSRLSHRPVDAVFVTVAVQATDDPLTGADNLADPLGRRIVSIPEFLAMLDAAGPYAPQPTRDVDALFAAHAQDA
ncbi:hypothetical protein [Bifidobacterium castoris]|uniref:Uncharacterized protein n=1 Tax=Bifidobacterium castoris TaxID=2306972 RepID=A0A430FA88_9BIFI|nr:hypothetical protein [Bifidobacterium castoris]RSX49739.1 hypothetical protein D2E22_0200 [Bifidobacterium castoris]